MTDDEFVTVDATVIASRPSPDRTITFVLKDDQEYAQLQAEAEKNNRHLAQQAHRFVQEALGLRPSEAMVPRAAAGATNGSTRARPPKKS